MKDALRILATAQFCNIATVCEDGSLWNTPVFFVADEDQNIYWWSALKANHSQNIMRDSRVYITVLDPNATQNDGLAVYMKAQATMLEDPSDIHAAISLYNERSTFVKLTEEICSGQAPTRIFKAMATSIWLNAEGSENGYYVDVRKQIV